MEDDARTWLSQARKKIDPAFESRLQSKRTARLPNVTMNDYYLPWLEGRTFKSQPLKAGVDKSLASMPSNQQAMRANAYTAMQSIIRTTSQHGLPAYSDATYAIHGPLRSSPPAST